jgi:hypothetical protein
MSLPTSTVIHRLATWRRSHRHLVWLTPPPGFSTTIILLRRYRRPAHQSETPTTPIRQGWVVRSLFYMPHCVEEFMFLGRVIVRLHPRPATPPSSPSSWHVASFLCRLWHPIPPFSFLRPRPRLLWWHYARPRLRSLVAFGSASWSQWLVYLSDRVRKIFRSSFRYARPQLGSLVSFGSASWSQPLVYLSDRVLFFCSLTVQYNQSDYENIHRDLAKS